MLIWDFDTGIGQINASYPYNFRQEPILREIKNVEIILQTAVDYNVKMTFACVGIAAEPGPFPYHLPDLIRQIYEEGHEIASHSWKHEWFPFLEAEQIRRSLRRSKKILEECIGIKGSVQGFVPPFNRPMSWYRKLAVSLGDRVWGPWYPGADIGNMLIFLREAGYKWSRLSYRSLSDRLKKVIARSEPKWKNCEYTKGITIIPHHYCGFDVEADLLVDYAIKYNKAIVISGHPGALSRRGREHADHFKDFIKKVSNHQEKGKLSILTVQQYANIFITESQ